MNFNLVIDTSNFKPFTYLEKIAPLLLYKETLDKAQENLEKYAEDYAGILEQLPLDSLYASTVLELDNRLRSMSGELALGISSDNLMRAKQLITQGRQTLTPIKNMIKAYNDDIAFYNNIRASHPEAILPEKEEINIDDYYGGKGNLIRYINGDAVAKESAMSTKAVLSQLEDDIVFKQSDTAKQFLIGFQKNPMSLEEVYRISKDPNYDAGTQAAASKIYSTLSELYTDIHERWNPEGSALSDNNDRVLRYYISQGALAGFPDAVTKAVGDDVYMANYLHELALKTPHKHLGGARVTVTERGRNNDPAGNQQGLQGQLGLLGQQGLQGLQVQEGNLGRTTTSTGIIIQEISSTEGYKSLDGASLRFDPSTGKVTNVRTGQDVTAQYKGATFYKKGNNYYYK